jgi:hypothetical protein
MSTRSFRKLAPIADDAAFTLTLGLQSAADKGDVGAIKVTLGALAVRTGVAAGRAGSCASANLMLGILVEPPICRQGSMPPLKDRFMAAAGHLDKAAAVSRMRNHETRGRGSWLRQARRQRVRAQGLKELAGAVRREGRRGEPRARRRAGKEVSVLRTRSRRPRPRPD